MSISSDGQICFGVIRGKVPIPFGYIIYCSYEYPMYLLCVKDTYKNCSRREAIVFDPEKLQVTEEQISSLYKFCEDYKVSFAGEAKWYLTSLYG